jgi:hypothetical protein
MAREARLVTDDAAKGGGPADRARGLGADRERDHPIRHRSRRAARRAAGRALWIVRVAGRTGEADRELRGDGLAQHEASRRLQPAHAVGIRVRPMTGVDRGVVLGRHVGRRHDVLHPHRQAVQRTRPAGPVDPASRLEGALGLEPDEGSKPGLTRLDPLEACAHQRVAGEIAGDKQPPRLACAQLVGTRRPRHARFPYR